MVISSVQGYIIKPASPFHGEFCSESCSDCCSYIRLVINYCINHAMYYIFVVVSVDVRVFEDRQNAPEICLSEMRQIITSALRTVFGEVRCATFILLLVFLI